MTDDVIETFDLSKTYYLKKKKEIEALKNVNIKIKRGEIFGMLGPNGAGKTTIVQILTTLLQPTKGYAIIDGLNLIKKSIEIKKRIGLMLASGMIYNRITGYQNLKFFCKIYNIKNYKDRILQIAKEFNLTEWLDQYVEKYSTGMKIKLCLCRALLIDPPILFLDEPTLGLDVVSTLFLIDKLKHLNKTIFLTSHNMHVIEKLCERIAFINKGTILKIGTQDELKSLMQSEINVSIEIKDNVQKLLNELKLHNFIKKVDSSDNSLIVTMNDNKYYKDLFSILANFDVTKIQEQELSLDNLFNFLIK